MTRALTLCAAAAICLGAALFAWPQTSTDPLDSLKVCTATQHLIFENRFVRVLDDAIPVVVAQPLHRHPHGVVVYLTDYTVEQTMADGKKTTGARKAATVRGPRRWCMKSKMSGQRRPTRSGLS